LGYLSQNKNKNKQILAFGEPIRSTTNPDKKKKCFTCIDTGKSSAKSGGKNRSACFLVNEGLPDRQ
jgi:hypothetical protein